MIFFFFFKDIQFVDDDGRFKAEAGEPFKGKLVLEEGNEEVLKFLSQ